MIRFFAGHPTAANLLMLAFLAVGFVFAPAVKRQTFPEIPPNSVQVSIPFPGAAAQEVEEALCQRVEEAVSSIDDLDETDCEARESLASAVLKMRDGGDLDRFLDDVKTQVAAIDDFPDDVETPLVRLRQPSDLVAAIAVAGPMDPRSLKAYAERMKRGLLGVPGVARVSVEGFSQRQIRIEAPASTLRQFGLGVRDLANAVASQSLKLPAGAVETRDATVLVRFDDERRDSREFEDLVVVASESGAAVRLGDIAVVTDRFEKDEAKDFFNGQRTAFLGVEKGKGDDLLEVFDAITAWVEEERQRAPPGVVLDVTRDVASVVRDRLTMLLRNGVQGLGLVLLVMWLFFGLRYSFWVAAGLPVAFMGTIAAMAMTGYSFDMVTMVGLMIAVGLMMDDAIVISENIARHHAAGRPPLEAAVEGAREVAPGVLASYLTTLAVFGALAFLRGNLGTILAVLPVILILTLSLSLVEAFLILPHHLMGTLRAREGSAARGLRARFDAGLGRFTEACVGRCVDAAVQSRYLACAVIAALFFVAASTLAAGMLKFRVFPTLEGNTMEARLLLPPGTPLARTEAVVGHVVEAVRKVDDELSAGRADGRRLVRNVVVQFNRNPDAGESGAHVATVVVDLIDSEARRVLLDDVVGRWRTEVGDLPDVVSLNFTQDQVGPGGKAISVRLAGGELEKLKAASTEIRQWLGNYRGVFDLTDDLRPGKPEMRLRLREGALALGLDAATVARQLRAAFHGRNAGTMQVGPEDYEVNVRLTGPDRDSLADLTQFTITLPDGGQAPLHAVAVLEPGRGYARIRRIDGRRAVRVEGNLDPQVANASEVVADTQARLLPELAARYPEVTVEFGGSAREGSTLGASLARNFLVGLAAIYLLLSFQFRSYVEPLVVMASIPVGLVGVVAGHLAMGLELSMPSVVGFVSLAGVVVNNAIVLVAFIKLHRRRGESAAQGARRAARQRFRAILLTSLTTVAGVLPLLMETSLQAQVLVPLVASLAFGLAASTFQILFLVPALYAILDDLGLTEKVAAAPPAGDAAPPPAEGGSLPLPSAG